MTAAALLAELSARGVVLTVRDGKLHVKAPAGSLSEADREALAQYREELLGLLATPSEGETPSDRIDTIDKIRLMAEVEGQSAPATVRLHCGWCGTAIADGVVCGQARCRAALERYPWLQPLRVREVPRG